MGFRLTVLSFIFCITINVWRRNQFFNYDIKKTDYDAETITKNCGPKSHENWTCGQGNCGKTIDQWFLTGGKTKPEGEQMELTVNVSPQREKTLSHVVVDQKK